jgi:hypothetical protein
MDEQRNVLNTTDPFFFAQCNDPTVLTGAPRALGTVMYLNHQLSPLDNLTFRAEFFDDMQGRGPARKPAT